MYRIHIHKLGSVHASLSRFLLLICLLLLSSEFLLGLSGRILDEQGSAIAGATITDKRAHCFSDEEGFFNLTTTADSLYISRIGYHNTALPTQSFRSPVILKAEAIVLPTVWVRAVEYKPSSPSLSVLVIHPDTNSEVSNTADLLLTNSSFSTTDTRLSGERQTVSLLGSFNRHSLVMMDGVVLNSAGEAFDFSKIPLGQISHIEIIKGDASVYGGSAAIGGIIHIHTKQAVDKASWEAGITSSLGSFGYLKQAYHASYRKKHFSLTTEYTHQCADNDFEYNTPDFWNMEPELKRLHNHKVADGFFAKTSYYTSGTQLDYSLNLGSFVRQLPGPINFLELYDDSKLTGAYAQHNLRGIITHRRLANELLLWYNTDASTYCNLEPTLFFGTNHYRQYQQSRGIKAASNLSYEDLKFNLSAKHSQVFYRFENRIQGSSISGTRESTALALGAQHNY
ncbi:MAG: TonB-dependent receptor plug domain-containing protein, partial [Candidatus Cloacimonetes bacterium]|nr:TonB-dependent receptor plug domain-containing protein [Candidatus Cloacimonadota bacterium]